MHHEVTIDRLFQAIICGDRISTRTIVAETVTSGAPAEELAHEVYWPLVDTINSLFRTDQLSMLAHHYAIRLLRTLVDQAQARFTQKPRNGRKVLMFSGPTESDDLSAQLAADLTEAEGYEVLFAGGGIANDEILACVGEQKPDVLLLFSAAPSDAPNIRQLIDHIRRVGACPNLQIVVGGGVFNRADGLAEEIGADVWAKTPQQLLEKLVAQQGRRAGGTQRTVGRNRRPNAAVA
jgi:methanogenic corrinoid protein MtbC1